MSDLRLRNSGVTRLVVALLLGALTFLVANLATSAALALLGAIATTAVIFDVSAVVTLWPMSPTKTHDRARQNSLPQPVEELAVVIAAVGSVAGIAVLIVLGDSGSRAVASALGLGGVLASWAMLHVMYAARYASLYYVDPTGGIEFAGHEDPCYRDFFYYSFTVGMTYAVSDSNAATTAIRAVTLRHALLAYVFGTVILAATINLVASIVIT